MSINKKLSKENMLILITVIVFLLLALIAVFFALSKAKNYNIVAYSLTEDTIHGPITYNNELYFHTEKKIKEKDLSKKLGLIEYDNRDYDLILMRVLYPSFIFMDKNTMDNTYLTTRGTKINNYLKARYIENETYTNNLIESTDAFTMFAFSTDFGEFDIEIEKEIVIELENTFGSIVYNKKDFNSEELIFYIYSTKKDKREEYIGTIFKSGDTLYYGNKTNEIKDEKLKERILETIK